MSLFILFIFLYNLYYVWSIYYLVLSVTLQLTWHAFFIGHLLNFCVTLFISDTLVKLMEYGDDDDDDLDDSNEEMLPRTIQANGIQKPFWAL